MADAKISELSSATALGGTEALPVVQSSTTVKATIDQAKTYVLTTPVAVVGNSTAGAELRLPEDTDNGSNYIALKAPDSIASNLTYTLPGTVTNGYYLTTDGSGTLSWGAGASLATPLAVTGNATAGAEIRLPEDTDNGSNYVAIKAPDSIASNITYTLPGTVTNGYYLQTDGSGTLSWQAVSGASAPLTLASGTLTDPSTALTITATYNDGADTFKSLAVDVTNTASASTSRPLEVTIGGTSVFSIDTTGRIRGRQSGSPRIWSGPTVVTGEYLYAHYIFAIGDTANEQGGFVIDTAGSNTVVANSGALIGFSSSSNSSTSPQTMAGNLDSCFNRVAAGVIGVRGASSSAGGALNFVEQTAPSAPSANQVVIYAEDNGGGKTRLMARFNTGAAQQIAIEP